MNTDKKKYITLKDDEGCDFRQMARIMSDAGWKMNHATARNQLIAAIKDVLNQSALKLNIKITPSQIDELVGEQSLQEYLGDVLYAAFTELKKENGESDER